MNLLLLLLLLLLQRGRKTLERFWGKKDEAVLKAFDQYLDAPDPHKFVSRIMEFLGESSDGDKVRAGSGL